jgi:phosphohistidine phosphatase
VRLLLLRHAKSDWSGKGDDQARPLSARGKRTAPRMGDCIRAKGYEPELVLCSTAERTKETLNLVLPALARQPRIRYERSLYLAEWPGLMSDIRAVSSPVSPLMVVGHNPGLEQLAIALALQAQSAAERRRLQKLAQKFPTAALAVLDFEIADWSNLKPGSGRLIDFVRPRDLDGDNDGHDA